MPKPQGFRRVVLLWVGGVNPGTVTYVDNWRCGASLGGTLDYIPNPTLRLKKQRVFTLLSAFLRSTNVGIVCDPSIEFIINQP